MGKSKGYGYTVYFVERGENRVMGWSPDTGEKRVVAGAETAQSTEETLYDPYGLAVGRDGHLIIADKLHSRLVRVVGGRVKRHETRCLDHHRRSRFRNRIHSPWTPTGLSTGGDGSLLACFTDDLTVYRVGDDGALTLALGVPLHRAIVRGYDPVVPAERATETVLGYPTSAVERADGTMFVIERRLNIIRTWRPGGELRTLFALSPDGRTPRKLPDPLTPETLYSGAPNGLALDAGENLYIGDGAYGCVLCLSADGRKLSAITTSEPGTPSCPSGLAFGPDGTLWVADAGDHSVKGFRKVRGAWRRVPATTPLSAKPGARQEYVGGMGMVCGK